MTTTGALHGGNQKKFTEREVQERVAFKMNDVYNAINAEIDRENTRMHIGGRKKYKDPVAVLEYVKERINKEIRMPLPNDEMAETRFKEARNKAVDKLANKLLAPSRGTLHHNTNLSPIVAIIEEAMRW